MKLVKSCALACLVLSTFVANSTWAASVSCYFMSETIISKSGAWVKGESDFVKLAQMFGDGLQLNLENSLLGKLDSKKPFLAGKVSRGNVYLMGEDMGVTGKLIYVSRENIVIYDGMCTVGFG